jgi:hypothetical protein
VSLRDVHIIELEAIALYESDVRSGIYGALDAPHGWLHVSPGTRKAYRQSAWLMLTEAEDQLRHPE